MIAAGPRRRLGSSDCAFGILAISESLKFRPTALSVTGSNERLRLKFKNLADIVTAGDVDRKILAQDSLVRLTGTFRLIVFLREVTKASPLQSFSSGLLKQHRRVFVGEMTAIASDSAFQMFRIRACFQHLRIVVALDYHAIE